MKIKYSNTVSKLFPWDIFQECVQLTNATPYRNTLHTFHFTGSKSDFSIIHKIPSIGLKSTITKHKECCKEIEDLIIYINENCIYALTLREFKKIYPNLKV